MAEIIPAFGGGEEGQARADRVPEFLHGASPCRAEQRLQLGEPQFDRIQVGTIRWEVPELGAGRFDPEDVRRLLSDVQVAELSAVASA